MSVLSHSALAQRLGGPGRLRRALPWALLVGLLLVLQSLLVWLTGNYENMQAQDRVETVAAESALEFKRELQRSVQALQASLWNDPGQPLWRLDAAGLLRQYPALLRIERRNVDNQPSTVVESPFHPKVFSAISRAAMTVESDLACSVALRTAAPVFSRSYFVAHDGVGVEVMDVCVPVQSAAGPAGSIVASYSLPLLLEAAATPAQARTHELTFVQGDGTRLARAGMPRGAGVYRAERLVDLPGVTLRMRVDSAEGRPRLIPNLTAALVLGLSLTLFAVVVLLLRDVRMRARAERALAEALAFRKAMEDSLSTGLRARNLDGHISYVNPAFCAMVGFSAEELMAAHDPPPYWPPEHVAEYRARQFTRLTLEADAQAGRAGFESVFMRQNGERFPVMIFEAPLVDGSGHHTGWMSAVLDVGAQRRMEETSRLQQERLQATARLATVGEMASLLGHELNQPLAAIASYATGSLNLMAEPDGETLGLVRQAVGRIAEQAERAGRVIKSVHDFVRRREHAREPVRVDDLLNAVLPLVRLQARKSGTRIELDIAQPVPRAVCDRTMIEQVLLNLTRNGIQAMEDNTPLAQRVLRLRVAPGSGRWVTFSVIDAGPGIAPEAAARLFTPFFTTRSEGMGLGLSLCRTVIEQHGGALDFQRQGALTEFRFTLPAASVGSAAAVAAATVS
jgi:two-component system sensor histidine kinase DctS